MDNVHPGFKQQLEKYDSLIHVGGNWGQECELYFEHDLEVFWVEADPSIFETLKERVGEYQNQTAVNELVAEESGKKI